MTPRRSRGEPGGARTGFEFNVQSSMVQGFRGQLNVEPETLNRVPQCLALEGFVVSSAERFAFRSILCVNRARRGPNRQRRRSGT